MAIKVNNLTVIYKQLLAVDDVSFSVPAGSIFGLIGPNGAGKTTTIECLEGLRKPNQGSLFIFDLDPIKDRDKLAHLVGVQLQETSYPGKIKVNEICRLFTSFYTKPLAYEDLLDQFDLTDKKTSYVSNLSGGQQQKLSIVLALIPNPKILFLDELTTGLDPHARRNMWEQIKRLRAKGITIFMTTHFMEEAEYLCDNIAIMNHGKIISMDSVSNLLTHSNLDDRISFVAKDVNMDRLQTVSGVNRVNQLGDKYTVFGKSETLAEDLLLHLRREGNEYTELNMRKPNLDDLFLALTGQNLSDTEETRYEDAV